jgi:hypothetical protein
MDGSVSQLAGVPKPVAVLLKVVRPVRDYTEARTLDLARRDLEVLPRPWHEGRAELARFDSTVQGKDLLSRVAGVAMPRMELFYTRVERVTALRDVAVLGLKVLVQRKRTGKLPADLAAIAPDAPVDRYSGKSYLYRALPDGFVVYSVGKDQADDGGDAGKDLAFRVRL